MSEMAHASPDPSAQPRPLLVGDADRAHVQDRLSRAVGLGELTLDEFDDRVQAALQARTGTDLRRLLADLPSAAADPTGMPVAWTPPTVPAVSPSHQVPVPTAASGSTGVRGRPAVRNPPAHPVDAWVRWAALAALMIAVWVAVGIPTGAWYPWPIWPILGTATCAIRQTVESTRLRGTRVSRAGLRT